MITKNIAQTFLGNSAPNKRKYDLNAEAKNKLISAFMKKCKDLAAQNRVGKPEIKCFISYAWDTTEFSKWIEWLATNLKDAGFDVLLDVWFNQTGEILTDYVEKLTEDSLDFIVVAGTPLFLEKYNRMGHNPGTKEPVVKFEAKLMNNMMMYNEERYKKIIPVSLTGGAEDCFPPFMRTKVYNGNFANDPYNHKALLDLALELYSINIMKIYQLYETSPEFLAIKKQFQALKSEFELQFTTLDAKITDTHRDAYEMSENKKAKVREDNANVAIDTILDDLIGGYGPGSNI